MILSVTLNPSVDHTLFVDGVRLGDTNRVQRFETDAGGKGINLSRIVRELQGDTIATGFLGGGPGAFVRHVLDVQDVPYDFVFTDRDTRTNVSIEDGQGGSPTTFNAQGPETSQEAWLKLVAKVEEHASRASWVALGGSVPPGLESTAFADLTLICRQRGAKVLVDADGASMVAAMSIGPDMIKPNLNEAARLLGVSELRPDKGSDAVRELQQKLGSTRKGGGNPIALLSMGRDGAFACNGQKVLRGYSPSIKVKSTIGSGDSMLGAFLWAMECGFDFETCLAWGLAAGAATAQTDGSRIATQQETESLVEQARVEIVADCRH